MKDRKFKKSLYLFAIMIFSFSTLLKSFHNHVNLSIDDSNIQVENDASAEDCSVCLLVNHKHISVNKEKLILRLFSIVAIESAFVLTHLKFNDLYSIRGPPLA